IPRQPKNTRLNPNRRAKTLKQSKPVSSAGAKADSPEPRISRHGSENRSPRKPQRPFGRPANRQRLFSRFSSHFSSEALDFGMPPKLLLCGYDIIGNIMTYEKLEKIKKLIADCRGKLNRHGDLERIALKLGRRRVKRGKEPTYESMAFPNANVVTIPNHAGKTVKRGTAANILNQLEEDVDRWEQRLITERGPVQYDESGNIH